jgi:hypothetical protein
MAKFIHNSLFQAVLSLVLLFSVSPASASGGEGGFNAKDFILHHVSDSHEIHFVGEGENSVAIPLPVILIDGGLKVFSSSNFYHHSPKSTFNPKTLTQDHYFQHEGYVLLHEKVYFGIEQRRSPHERQSGFRHVHYQKCTWSIHHFDFCGFSLPFCG